MRTLLRSIATVYHKLAAIPLVFLGIGVQRAWSTILFDQTTFPTATQEAYVAGMVCTVIVNFALAALAPRLSPLYRRTALMAVVAAGASLGSGLIVIDSFFVGNGVLSFTGTLLAMSATGASMLVWCEFFGALNPTRVALVYAAAIVFGEVLSFFLAGMDVGFLWPLIVLMPVFNIVWAVDSNARVAKEEATPLARGSSRVTYPIKLVALMAAVSLTESFLNVSNHGDALSILVGTAAVPCLIVLVTLLEPLRFRIDGVYRLAMPLIIVAMFMMLPSVNIDGVAPVILFCGGDTALTVMTMIVFSNISYRYGMNAVRLNGIERGIRYAAYVVGWLMQALLVPQLAPDQVFVLRVALAVVMVALFSVLFVSNSDPFSRWGMHVVKSPADDVDSETLRVAACDDVATQYKLTAREQEILLLLSQRKTALEIEKLLVIAQGTLKAHIGHIYAKMGIHARSELYALLEQRQRELFAS